MNRGERGISTAILIGVIGVAAVSVGAVAFVYLRPQPEFQVRNLSLSSDTVAKGEPVTTQVEVTNVGDAEGTHTVELEAEGETLEEEVTLDAGESKTVSFVIEKQEKGTYSINAEGLSETFEVVEPAKFELINLQVNPKKTEPEETVTVSLNVKNIGGIEGSHTVKMNVDGEFEGRKEVTLSPSETTQVTFTITKDASKSYSVEVGELSSSFEVLEPAEFELSNLTVSPSKVAKGKSVNVSVDVQNVGEAPGEYTVELKIDNSVEKNRTVPIRGGESTTVSFTLKKNTEKEYIITVGDLSNSFEVTSAVITRYFEWTDHLYEEWSWRMSIEEGRYEDYRNLSHTAYSRKDYLEFVTYKVGLIKYMADELSKEYTGPENQANYILSFVQSISYLPEKEQYIRYPVETLVDNGDCEDTAILYAAIMKAAGHDVALIDFENHIMAGVYLSELPQYGTQNYVHWFEKNGKRYYTCETTGEGWYVGELPELYQKESAKVYIVD